MSDPYPAWHPLQVERTPLDTAEVVSARGELDMATTPDLAHVLTQLRSAGKPTVLELDELSFIDACGLNLLITTAREASSARWPFWIAHPSRAVERMIELTDTGRLLPVWDGSGLPPEAAQAS